MLQNVFSATNIGKHCNTLQKNIIQNYTENSPKKLSDDKIDEKRGSVPLG